MANAPRKPGTGDEYGMGHDRSSPTARWVKIGVTILGILVLLFIVLNVLGGGGEHGPSRHTSDNTPSGQFEQQAPGGHKPPAGGHG